jgi:FkbM family methyltransferase
MPLLKSLDIDGVIDAGANRGQFTLACRLTKPRIPVVAFEPIPAEAETFKKVHDKCRHVSLIESALGETNGTATLHLSRSADSSSLLPIGKKQTELFSQTAEIGVLEVPVSRLDDNSEKWQGRRNQLLKIDVQGFELFVLKGGVETLKTCRYVYCECSEIPLYDGQALRGEVTTFLSEHGFVEEGQFNLQYDGEQLVQLDLLFRRT